MQGSKEGTSPNLIFLSPYSPATTSEGKMVKPSPKIKKNLDKIMKELLDNLKSLIPSRNDVMEP